MRLRVKHLGPVEAAELDLDKPLMILTGPNNSGKTYLGWVVYSLGRLDPNLVEPPESAHALARKLLESGSVPVEELHAITSDVLANVAVALQARVPEDFAAPVARFERTRIDLVGGQDRGAWINNFLWRLDLPSPLYLVLAVGDRAVLRIHESQLGSEESRERMVSGLEPSEKEESVSVLAKMLMQYGLLNGRDRYIYPLPVERAAINLFARELAASRSGLVDNLLREDLDASAMRGVLRRGAGRYPRAISDALWHAIARFDANRRSEFEDLATEIESSVMGGELVLDGKEQIEFRPAISIDRVSGLGLHESASVVKSLVSLVLFLRQHAMPGARVLIDEPEINLHPDNQRRFARILAKAVNRGLKVLLSTHSDIMIREFNNLIMLGRGDEQAKALARKLGYDPESTLAREKVAVYLVKGGRCDSLPITETGFEVETIDRAIHELNEDTQAIYLRLFGE